MTKKISQKQLMLDEIDSLKKTNTHLGDEIKLKHNKNSELMINQIRNTEYFNKQVNGLKLNINLLKKENNNYINSIKFHKKTIVVITVIYTILMLISIYA